MAWKVDGHALTMAEGDFGLALPVTLSGMQLAAGDCIRITIRTALNGETVLEKNYDTFEENTFSLVLTEEESALFHPGAYVYRMDVYQDGSYLCNVIPCGNFKVVDVA